MASSVSFFSSPSSNKAHVQKSLLLACLDNNAPGLATNSTDRNKCPDLPSAGIYTTSRLLSLPCEILDEIFMHTTAESLFILERTCVRFRRFLASSTVWESLARRTGLPEHPYLSARQLLHLQHSKICQCCSRTCRAVIICYEFGKLCCRSCLLANSRTAAQVNHAQKGYYCWLPKRYGGVWRYWTPYLVDTNALPTQTSAECQRVRTEMQVFMEKMRLYTAEQRWNQLEQTLEVELANRTLILEMISQFGPPVDLKTLGSCQAYTNAIEKNVLLSKRSLKLLGNKIKKHAASK